MTHELKIFAAIILASSTLSFGTVEAQAMPVQYLGVTTVHENVVQPTRYVRYARRHYGYHYGYARPYYAYRRPYYRGYGYGYGYPHPVLGLGLGYGGPYIGF